MFNARLVGEALSRASSTDVMRSLLLATDGRVVASSATETAALLHSAQDCTLGAICSQAFREYSTTGNGPCKLWSARLEQTTVAVAPLGDAFLLLAVCKPGATVGAVEAAVNSLLAGIREVIADFSVA